MTTPFQFLAATRVRCAASGLLSLGEEIQAIRGRQVLLVSDPGVERAGLIDRALRVLNDAGIPCRVYSEVVPNPSTDVVAKGFALLKEYGCDCLVALGGGSAIDTAKAIGILATHPGPLCAYEGVNKLAAPPPPLIAIPTTAGTGSEVTCVSVITDPERHYKAVIRSDFLAPRVALLDAELLLTLPPPIIAATGLDAFTHAYESFVSLATNPMAQALAIDAMRLIARHLRRFYTNPADRDAAEAMLIASTMAGFAFSSGRVGVIHAMAHPLGGHFNVPHGLANAILLPYCADFTRAAVPDLFCRIADAMGEDIRGLSNEAGARRAVEAIRLLLEDLKIPTSLRQVGADPRAIDRLTSDAVASGIHLTTPGHVTAETISELYDCSFQ